MSSPTAVRVSGNAPANKLLGNMHLSRSKQSVSVYFGRFGGLSAIRDDEHEAASLVDSPGCWVTGMNEGGPGQQLLASSFLHFRASLHASMAAQ